MKRLMNVVIVLLLTIGMINFNVTNLHASNEKEDETSFKVNDNDKSSNVIYSEIDTSLKLDGFYSLFNQLDSISRQLESFDKAYKVIGDKLYSVYNMNDLEYFYFNPSGIFQICTWTMISENLDNYQVTFYDTNHKQLYDTLDLLSENRYYDSKLGCSVVTISFTIDKPIYIRFAPKNNSGGNYIFGIYTRPPFKDVADDAWYYGTIKEAYDKGLMSGTSVTKFQPDAKMTRGMVATVLYRMAGAPNVAYVKKFSDVKQSDFFSIAVTWASNNKVINGYGKGKFGPNDNITREQMAAMCYNYAKFRLGKTPTATASLTKFKDYKNVTKNMEIPMKWAVASGLISGSNGKLNPTGKATRAECAKMLLQLSKIVK